MNKKKLNNKGFAISTVLYGLLVVLILLFSLVINIMSFNRKSSKDFVEGITSALENQMLFELDEITVDGKAIDKFYTGENYNLRIKFRINSNYPIEINQDTVTYYKGIVGDISVGNYNEVIPSFSIKKADEENTFYIDYNMYSEYPDVVSLHFKEGLFTNGVKTTKAINIELFNIIDDRAPTKIELHSSKIDDGGYLKVTLSITRDSGKTITNDTSKVVTSLIGNGYLKISAPVKNDYCKITGSNEKCSFQICRNTNCEQSGTSISNGFPPYMSREDIFLEIPANKFSNHEAISIDTKFNFCNTASDSSCSGEFYRD